MAPNVESWMEEDDVDEDDDADDRGVPVEEDEEEAPIVFNGFSCLPLDVEDDDDDAP